jgi:hypothetical protein
MSETAKKTTAAKATAAKTEGQANTAVPHEGDHDRVGMLSLRADGTPDQHNPEIIGDKATALVAAKEQFAQQAVSAADAQRRAAEVAEQRAAEEPEDPAIAAAKAEDESIAEAAEKAAESVVDELHQG